MLNRMGFVKSWLCARTQLHGGRSDSLLPRQKRQLVPGGGIDGSGDDSSGVVGGDLK